jgi:hypothetical protein
MIDHLNGLDYAFMAFCFGVFGGIIWHIWRGKPYRQAQRFKADLVRAVLDRSEQPLCGSRQCSKLGL